MSKRDDFIIPECYIDTNLVETLVCSNGCNHQKGCNQVAKVMKEKFADRFALGIIDADKRRPGYLNEFSQVVASRHLEIFRHDSRAHYFLIVHPAADGFILDCAVEANLNIQDFGLSPILKEFTSQTKNVLSNKDTRFKGLFRAMTDVGEIKLMTSLIKYLAEHSYSATDRHIIDLFHLYT